MEWVRLLGAKLLGRNFGGAEDLKHGEMMVISKWSLLMRGFCYINNTSEQASRRFCTQYFTTTTEHMLMRQGA